MSGVTVRSPPSRGAWIEIIFAIPRRRWRPSPPSRGAWIEIMRLAVLVAGYYVAPLAGGVD